MRPGTWRSAILFPEIVAYRGSCGVQRVTSVLLIVSGSSIRARMRCVSANCRSGLLVVPLLHAFEESLHFVHHPLPSCWGCSSNQVRILRSQFSLRLLCVSTCCRHCTRGPIEIDISISHVQIFRLPQLHKLNQYEQIPSNSVNNRKLQLAFSYPKEHTIDSSPSRQV